MAQLRREQATIEAMGARLVFVGNGTTDQAREFHDRYAPGNAVFTDPSAYTYRAIGAHSGMATTVGGILVHGPRAVRQGHIQTSIKGRPFQHGGIVVALPGDVAAYAYVSKVAGDHPPNTEILAALAAVTPGAHDGAIADRAQSQGTFGATTGQAIAPAGAAPSDGAAGPGLPGWPGAPPGPPQSRQPRWSFEMPEAGPHRSAAG